MDLERIFEKWVEILRLKNNWDIQLKIMKEESFWKTGDFKVDPTDRKAILMLKVLNTNK